MSGLRLHALKAWFPSLQSTAFALGGVLLSDWAALASGGGKESPTQKPHDYVAVN